MPARLSSLSSGRVRGLRGDAVNWLPLQLLLAFPDVDDDLETLLEVLKHRCTHLNLQGSVLGRNGAARLARGLEVNDSVETVSVAGNEISDDGVARLSNALLTNADSAVTCLDVGCE